MNKTTQLPEADEVLSPDEIKAMTTLSVGLEDDEHETFAFYANHYKLVGIILVAIGVAFFICRKVFEIGVSKNADTLVNSFTFISLFGLVLISVAKRNEDFITKTIRANAFRYATIFAIALQGVPWELFTTVPQIPRFHVFLLQLLGSFYICFYAERDHWVDWIKGIFKASRGK